MFEQIVILAQLVTVMAIAAWMTTGVWDNILHPSNNESFTAQVMGMTRMQQGFPDEFQRVAHRAIVNRSLQKLAFRVVVVAEVLASLILWAGAVLLALSLFGSVPIDIARAVALAGALLFTSVWAGFLVVGNYFCYWFCHEWGQNTHFQMTIWGMATMIFLVAA